MIELISTDNLKSTQAKMQEYADNGVQLGWLFNRKAKEVEIYQPGKSKQVLQQPDKLLGEPVLPNFVLNLDTFW